MTLAAGPAFAYHPFSTEDPGTTEFRHFELEFGNELLWPEGKVDEFGGYLAVKSGLAPGLEFDAAINYMYFLDVGPENLNGWGDSEMLLKYRFLGDGDGPNNLGIEAAALFPSGESDKGLSEGDDIIPTILMFGTIGQDSLRLMFNTGVTIIPEDNDSFLYHIALEWTCTERLILMTEVFGETDSEADGDGEPVEGMAGAVYSAADWLTLSAGFGWGMSPDAPDYRFTFAALFGW